MCNLGTQKVELPFVAETVFRILSNASSAGPSAWYVNDAIPPAAKSRNAELLATLFSDESNRDTFLCQSHMFERMRGQPSLPLPVPADRVQQLSAKLHCLFGDPVLTRGRTRSGHTHPWACSRVFDLRRYSDRARWGPYLADFAGPVDWENLEAVLIDVGFNVKRRHVPDWGLGPCWGNPFAGSWPRSFIPSAGIEPSPLDLQDPYGVSGTWLRVAPLALFFPPVIFPFLLYFFGLISLPGRVLH